MTAESVETIPLRSGEVARSQRPRRVDAVANEQLILATAQRLSGQVGIEAATMSMIAAEAGIGKGTLYRAFANKGMLCLALMDDDLRGFQEETLAHLGRQADVQPLAALAGFLDRLVRFMDGHAALLCEAEAHGALHNRPEINQTSLHDWFRLTVLLLLRRAAETGEIEGSGDLDYLADAVLAPLNPRLIRHQLHEERLSVDHVSRQLVRFVMNGLRP